MRPTIGIDTSSFTMHGVSLDGARVRLYEGRSNLSDADARRAELLEYASRLFPVLPRGGHVFCEEPLALQNGSTTRVLSLAAGAIWAAWRASGADLWWHWVDVTTWKKRVVGKGNASKGDVRLYVIQTPRYQELDRELQQQMEDQPDLYDAWCLAEYGRAVLP